MTAGSNMTGAAGNATGGSMHTAKPAGYLKQGIIIAHLAHPAGVNTTSTSNMTGAAGNMTAGSTIHTTKPAGTGDGYLAPCNYRPVPGGARC